MRSELRRNRAHTARRHNGIAFGEHLENEFKHAAGGFQVGIEKNSGKKRAKKAMDKFFRKSVRSQGIFCGTFGTLENLVDGGSPKARTQAENAQFIGKSGKVRFKSFLPCAGSAPRIDQLVHASGKKRKCARSEFSEIERVIIKRALRFRIGREQNLKPAIEEKSLELVRADAAANSVRGFKNLE